jgi:hypothetical protein
MIGKNSSRRVESSLKRTRFVGHLGLMVGVFRELEIDKLIDEKLPKERDHNIPHSVCILAMVLCDEKVIPWIAVQSALLSIQNVPTLMCISGNGFVQSSEDNEV